MGQDTRLKFQLYWAGPLLVWLSLTGLGLVPPVSRDALNDHLMLPLLWQEHGLFWRDAWLSFTANPPLADIPYALFAAYPWDWLASVWHATGALVAMLLLNICMRRLHLASKIRAWVMILWLTTPVVVTLCAFSYVDLWLCATASGLSALLLLPAWHTRHAWLFGLCLGAALLIKYNGLALAIAGMLALAVRWHARPGCMLSWAWRASLACFFVAAGWYVGNYLQLGGVLYPLGTQSGIGWLAYRIEAYGETPWWAAMAPVRQFFWGEAGNPRLFDGMLQPLVLLAFAGAYRLRRSPRVAALLLMVLAYALFALQVGIRARYWLPGIIPLYPLAGYALSRMRRWFVWLLAAGLAPALSACVVFWLWLAPWQFWLQGRDAYLSAHLADYPVQHWAGTHLPPDAKVYLLWMGGRAYYLQRSYGSDFGHEGERLRRAIWHGGEFPFTYILMNRRLADRMLGTELGPGWNRWLNSTCRLARQGDFELRRLSPCK